MHRFAKSDYPMNILLEIGAGRAWVWNFEFRLLGFICLGLGFWCLEFKKFRQVDIAEDNYSKIGALLLT